MSLDNSLAVIDALMAEPKTIGQIVEQTGLAVDVVGTLIRKLRDRHRVEFHAYAAKPKRGIRPTVWRWVA